MGAACKGHFRAASREDLKRQVFDHFRARHAVERTATIENLVERHVREAG